MFEDSESRFLALMIASEIVITLIAFVGAYYIFKPLLKPKDMDELGNSLLEDDKPLKEVKQPDEEEDLNK
jgi:hypothetical protein